MLYYVVRAVFWLLLRFIFAVLGGLRITGLHHVPRRGAVIIAPNHVSNADAPLIGAATPRFAYFMATEELFVFPIIGQIARLMRGYPIRQDSPDRAALRHTEKLLKAGEAVVIFPEGHLSKTGQLQPLQGGPILIAMRTGVPVVPVAISGTEKILPPPHQFRIRHARQHVHVRFGPPLTADELTGGRKGREGVEHGVMVLTQALLRLQEEIGAEMAAFPVSADKEKLRYQEGVAERCNEQ